VVLPRLGLALGSLALAGLGLLAAGLALLWARDRELTPRAEPEESRPRKKQARKAKEADSGLSQTQVYAILAFTGLAGVGLEVVGLQVMTQLLQNTVYTFANLLAVYLVGTALGAWLYARQVARRPRSPKRSPTRTTMGLLWAHVLAVALAAVVLRSGPDLLASLLPETATQGRHFFAEMAFAASVFLVPTVLMGALFSHLMSFVAARGVGRAYALNTLGATLAPLVFGLGAMRATSYATALKLVGALYLAIFLAVALRSGRRDGRLVLATAVGLVVCLLSPTSLRLVPVEEGWKEIATQEGLMGLVMVTELEGSEAPGRNLFRRLQVNEHFRMGGSVSFGEQRMGHIPLLFVPAAREVLFLGIGTGATLSAVRHFPAVEGVDAVELVPSVLDFLPLFEHVNEKIVDDPRVRFHTADARRFVAAARQDYDLVVGDLFHPGRDGAGSLFSREHFQGVREHLADGGVYAQWLPLYQFDIPNLKTVVRTFLDVFPEVHSFLGLYNARTPAVVLMGRAETGEPWIGRAELEERLRGAAYPRLQMDDPREVMASYMLDRDALLAFAGEGPRNTDLNPRVLFDAPRHTAYEADLHEINWQSFEALLAHRTVYPPSFLSDDGGLRGEVERFSRALTLHLRGEIGRARGQGRVTPEILDLHLAAYDAAPDLEVVSGYLLNFARNNPGASEHILEAMLQSTPGNRDILGEYIGFLHWQRNPRFLEVLRDAQARFGKDAFPDP
jgi:spermidine synthase